ncbi:MAG: hypothetical protein V7637_5037 [Mycobacteriales bacterium]
MTRAVAAVAVAAALLAAAVVVAVATPSHRATAAAAVVQVDNSKITYDTFGARIDAHDGRIVQDPAGVLWLFGTSYGCGFRFNKPSAYCGVRVYRSTDAQTWTPAGAVGGMYAFDALGPEWQNLCGGAAFGCFEAMPARRPDGTWVMWIQAGHLHAGYRVLTAPAPGGPYTPTGVDPVLAVSDGSGLPYGAETIYPDPTDPATAWLAYTTIDHVTKPGTSIHDIVVEKLDPTWTTGGGPHVRLGLLHSEGPGLFKRGNTWYLTYSDPACAYCATGTGWATAPSPLGPWSATRGQLRSGSCGGQPTGVDVLRGSAGKTWYVWQVDRWVRGPNNTLIPNQYLANNYLAPITFNANGSIPVQTCTGRWTF